MSIAGRLPSRTHARLERVHACFRRGRAYLDRNGLGDYRILHCANHERWEVDQLLAGPGESEGVNVSTFLNRLDGIETNLSGGLLLIATTNHLEKLDPAINNRPGRFDVVIEVPSPDSSLRLTFFHRKLPDVNSEVLERLAESTEGLSFAHLQEILRLSGLLAIKAC